MKNYLLSIFFPMMLLIPIGSAGQIIDHTIDKLAEKYADKHKNRALVIGVISGEKTEVKGYGHVSRVQDFKPDEHTIFEIGSVSGVFTTTLLMLETQKGSFRLDDRITDFLPEDIYMPAFQPFTCHMEETSGLVATGHERMRMICEPDPDQMPVSISFCDLASHTSGLPNTPRGFYTWNPLQWLSKHSKDPYSDFSREELYNNLYRYVLSVPPGSFFQYSEAGMSLLGNILTDYNHTSYNELLSSRLLGPLGMYDTGIEVPINKATRFAAGHDRKGRITDHWHYDAMAPAAGLRSTAGDLLRLLRANLDLDNNAIGDALAQVQQPRIDVPKHKTGRETMGGYGWFISILSEETNLPVNWINGGTGGFRSFVAFNRDRNIGIVILSNSANAVDKMGFKILEHLVQRKDQKFVIESILEKDLEIGDMPEIYFMPLRS
ncbi:MAG: beta-lactamase family protein [Saprospiraceae bacterium]|nr:beta-lactamase family protein [Saprospiraceae bacterium]